MGEIMEFPENPMDFIKDHQRHTNGIRKTDHNGWIPVSERLPNEEEFIKSYCRNRYAAEFIVMIKGATKPTTLYYRNGIWADEENTHYNVIAWQPLPEPYRKGEPE